MRATLAGKGGNPNRNGFDSRQPMFHVKHYFYLVFSESAKLYLNAVTFGNAFFNLLVIKVAHLDTVRAFGAYAYNHLAGFARNIGNVADKLNLPDVLPRTVKLAGVKALYRLCVYVFTHFELSETKFKDTKIGVI